MIHAEIAIFSFSAKDMSFLIFTNWHLVKKTKMVTELTQKYVGRGLQFCSCEFIKEKGFKKPSYRTSFKKTKENTPRKK